MYAREQVWHLWPLQATSQNESGLLLPGRPVQAQGRTAAIAGLPGRF